MLKFKSCRRYEGNSPEQQLKKINEEFLEFREELRHPHKNKNVVAEGLDVITAMMTFLTIYSNNFEMDLKKLHADHIEKNKRRGYYEVEKPVEKHYCKHCGKEFVPSVRFKVYCSEGCQAERRKKPILYKYCKCCGKRFVAERGNVLYCSDKCKAEMSKAIKCKYCGKKFIPKYKNQLYCGVACANRDLNKRASVATVYTHTCKGCGNEFKTKNIAQQFCSMECKRKLSREKKNKNKKITGFDMAQKAKIADALSISYGMLFMNQGMIKSESEMLARELNMSVEEFMEVFENEKW